MKPECVVHDDHELFFIYIHSCDSDNSAVLIGVVVGVVDCAVIIIMVITNIIVWLYCFRKRHHTGITGSYMYVCYY